MKVFQLTRIIKTGQAWRGSLAILLALALLSVHAISTEAKRKTEARPQTVQTSFSNPSSINVADPPPSNTPPGVASLYPSNINVAGMGTSITNLTVKLTNVNHAFPPDFDVLLVGPGGQSLVLQSDAGSATAAVNRSYTFDDAATVQLPNSGGLPNNTTVKPTNYQGNDGTSDLFPAPAPAGPYGNPGPQASGAATLNGTFGGTNPNGVWSLYVTDDEFLDTGQITGGWTLNITATTPAVPLSRVSDYDGDNKTDTAVVRNISGQSIWYVNGTTSGFSATGWGTFATDVYVPQDYDGDGKTDIAVWRQTNGVWFILQSSNGALRVEYFGATGDVPTVVDDYDGDGKADPAVVRNVSGLKNWYILGSTSGFSYKQWGLATDTIAPGDYDGDGKADVAVRRADVPSAGNATFFIDGSTSGFQAVTWGGNTDAIASGDYDGDGKTDIAVARVIGSNLIWNVLLSGGGVMSNNQWGANGDVITPGDYNGDNKTDLAVWRPSNGYFYILLSTGGFSFMQFGLNGDYPPANSFVH